MGPPSSGPSENPGPALQTPSRAQAHRVAGWGAGPGLGTPHTRAGGEGQLLRPHQASLALPEVPTNRLGAPAQPLGSPRDSHSGQLLLRGGGGEEMVCRERFVLLQLFRARPKGEGKSGGWGALVLSGNMCGAGDLFGKKQKHKFLSVSRPRQSSKGPHPVLPPLCLSLSLARALSLSLCLCLCLSLTSRGLSPPILLPQAPSTWQAGAGWGLTGAGADFWAVAGPPSNPLRLGELGAG